MATECRKTTRVDRNKRMKIYGYSILAMLFVTGGIVGYVIGVETTPTETEVVYKTDVVYETEVITVEVPVTKLPEVKDVLYFDVPLSHSLQRYIYEICAVEGAPVTLVMAMIEHESQFNQDVVSSSDDYGLMQINKINHEWLEEEYRCADMLNPYQNVFCGVKILSQYLVKYNGDYTKALMAYNMGEYGASKAWENGISSTNYSTNVLTLMQKYEEVAHEQ